MLQSEFIAWFFGFICGWLAVMWTLYVVYTHPRFVYFVMSGIIGIAITGLALIAYEAVTALRLPTEIAVRAGTPLIGAMIYGAMWILQKLVWDGARHVREQI